MKTKSLVGFLKESLNEGCVDEGGTYKKMKECAYEGMSKVMSGMYKEMKDIERSYMRKGAIRMIDECLEGMYGEGGMKKESFHYVTETDDGDGNVENEQEFRAYATKMLKKAHGDDYDKAKANKMINDFVKKYKDDDDGDGDADWGDAVGAFQASMD